MSDLLAPYNYAEKLSISEDEIMKVEDLVSCIENSTIFEDRLDAILYLKDLCPKMRLHIGTLGLHAYIDILKVDTENTTLVHHVLDLLKLLLQPDCESSIEEDFLGDSLAELFVSKPDLMDAIFQIMDTFDFSVRKSLVQFLIPLFRFRSLELRDIIINQGNGICKIVDLLQDQREVIRNNVVLMLSEMSRGNGVIQQMLVYENVFQILFSIIQDESPQSIVIEDCLFLMYNLLKRNDGNQKYFFEDMNLVRLLTETFDKLIYPGGDRNFDVDYEYSKQTVTNIIFALECVRALVSTDNIQENIVGAQKAFSQTGLLKTLCHAMFTDARLGLDVVYQTIITTSEIIRGNPQNQDFFINTIVHQERKPICSLAVLMEPLIVERLPFKLRSAALYSYMCYVHNNENGKNLISKAIIGKSDGVNSSAVDKFSIVGYKIMRAIKSNKPFQVWGGCLCLLYLLFENNQRKEDFLSCKIDDYSKTLSLFEWICVSLFRQDRSRNQIKSAYLMLITTWIDNFPPAVKILMQQSDLMQFFSSEFQECSFIVNENEQRTVKGLIAFLLMTIYNNIEESKEKDSIMQLIKYRLGIVQVSEAIERLSQTEFYLVAASKPTFNPKTSVNVYLDYHFCRLIKVYEKKYLDILMSKNRENNGESIDVENIISEHKKEIASKDEEIKSLKDELEKAKVELENLKHQNITLQTSSFKTTQDLTDTIKMLNEIKQKNQSLESETNFLKENVCLWQQEAGRFKQWADEWQAYQINQLPNPQDIVVSQLTKQVEELNTLLDSGYKAYDQQGKTLLYYINLCEQKPKNVSDNECNENTTNC
uniref:Uso1_p115_head domain-containing protein n=1 Tax=Strongyloides papillosus TaxID=174720 RepID=A0A0N5B8I6_STREA